MQKGIESLASRAPSNLLLNSDIFETFKAHFRVRNINQTGKHEAIFQKHLFIDLSRQIAMPRTLDPSIRSKILRLLLLHWCPKAIAEEVNCHFDTVYRIQENFFTYGSPFRPHFRLKGASRKVFPAAEDSLITYLEQQPWAMQKEMVWFLWEEWGIHVHRSTNSGSWRREAEAIKRDSV